MDIQEKIRSIPASPGVYLYKNAAGEVIYVGKAKSLRHRVSSYFHEGRPTDAKTGTLLREAVDVDYIDQDQALQSSLSSRFGFRHRRSGMSRTAVRSFHRRN